MREELERRGIPLVAKQYSDIAKALKPVVVKHYHQLIGTCIKHIRASHLTLDMLLQRAQSLQDKERARIFSRVVYKIAQAYSEKLVDAGRIDFDSMIADATQLVETKQYKRETKTGRSFIGCSQYPNCRHVVFSGKQKQNRSRALRRPTVQ